MNPVWLTRAVIRTYRGAGQRVFWFDGNALIGARPLADGALPWRPDATGLHLIRIVDDHGRSAERDVEVKFTRQKFAQLCRRCFQ